MCKYLFLKIGNEIKHTSHDTFSFSKKKIQSSSSKKPSLGRLQFCSSHPIKPVTPCLIPCNVLVPLGARTPAPTKPARQQALPCFVLVAGKFAHPFQPRESNKRRGRCTKKINKSVRRTTRQVSVCREPAQKQQHQRQTFGEAVSAKEQTRRDQQHNRRNDTKVCKRSRSVNLRHQLSVSLVNNGAVYEHNERESKQNKRVSANGMFDLCNGVSVKTTTNHHNYWYYTIPFDETDRTRAVGHVCVNCAWWNEPCRILWPCGCCGWEVVRVLPTKSDPTL